MEQSGAEFYGGQEWEVRQAELAERYEAPLVTVDSAGEAITGCARCPDFCRVIMVNPVSRRGCQAHCAALAAEALRLGGVAAALCPCGLYTGALPLVRSEISSFCAASSLGQKPGTPDAYRCRPSPWPASLKLPKTSAVSPASGRAPV